MLSILSTNARGETITIPGISGITFDTDQSSVTITREFKLFGIDVQPQSLTLEYANDVFKLYGSAKISFESENITVSMGSAQTPGLQITNGELDHLTFGLTGKFQLRTLEFSEQGLTFEYDKASSQYALYGSSSITLGKDNIKVTMGNMGSPGIVIDNGELTKLNLLINGNFQLQSFDFKATNLDFQYQLDSMRYQAYGNLSMTLENEQIEVGLGTASDPGIIYADGDLKQINLSTTDDLEFFGLSLKTNQLDIKWDSTDGNYNFSGDVSVQLGNDNINANFGTVEMPGLVYSDGSLESFDLTLNSNFSIGDLSVSTKDTQIEYLRDTFFVTGIVEAKITATVEVALGQNGVDGLVIDATGDTDKIIVDDITISVDHFNFGAVDLKSMDITIKNGALSEADLSVSFPPGWEVDGKATFKDGALDSIGIAYEATSIDAAIPVGTTGIYIVEMGGALGNLEDPSQTITFTDPNGNSITSSGINFEGTVGFTFGGPVSLLGQTAALLYQSDTVVITASELNIDADLLVGAYLQGTTWMPLLGDGSMTADFDWGNQYSVTATMNLPPMPNQFISFMEQATLSSDGTFDAFLTVDLTIPEDAFVGGGDQLASVSGAIRYNQSDPGGSYVAGWGCVAWVTAGAEYNFGSGDICVIGGCTVDDITAQINSEIGGGMASGYNFGSQYTPDGTEDEQWFKSVHIFSIPPQNIALRLQVEMGENVGEVYVTTLGPGGFYDMYELVPAANGASGDLDRGEIKHSYQNTSGFTTFLTNHDPVDPDAQNEHTTLVPGEYDILIAYKSEEALDDIKVIGDFFYPNARGTINAIEAPASSYLLELDYWAQYPDSTKIDLFWSNTKKHSGHHYLGLPYGQPNEEGRGELEVLVQPQHVSDGDSLYFYYVVEDSTNTPYYSDFSPGFIYRAPVSGKVTVKDADGNELDEAAKGFLTFIDANEDGNHDTKSTNGEFEKSSVVTASGSFHYNGINIGERYVIQINLPEGYRMNDGADSSFSFVYTGAIVNVEFNLVKE